MNKKEYLGYWILQKIKIKIKILNIKFIYFILNIFKITIVNK
jgi:hypothetical protein